jgi:glutaredoxin
MKKIMLFVVTAVLLISPLVAASTMTSSEETYPQRDIPKTTSNFTHTVFIEEGTATWCPSCPNAAEALFSIYNSSNYPFYYVALVYDQTKLGKDRMYGHYRGFAFPTIFIDGGFSQKVGGASTPQLVEQLYRPLIEEAGARTVHPLEITTNVTGHGDAKLEITVTVKNTGNKPYIGILRSYVTEIVSRWDTLQGHPYHFALLDYAIKKIIFISPQKTQTYTATFDGAAQHGNLTFPDIVDNNIMVISTVSHWQPHMIVKEQYVSAHLAFYIDQVTGAKVN